MLVDGFGPWWKEEKESNFVSPVNFNIQDGFVRTYEGEELIEVRGGTGNRILYSFHKNKIIDPSVRIHHSGIFDGWKFKRFPMWDGIVLELFCGFEDENTKIHPDSFVVKMGNEMEYTRLPFFKRKRKRGKLHV